MLSREDFKQAIDNSVARYPAVAALVRAGDPRILQHLEAMATMLAMYSAQVETAMAEPFEKVRDATVLADAAMRGLVPKSTPARVVVAITNSAASPFRIEQGRSLVDAAGRLFRVEIPVDVPSGGSATVEAVQLYAVAKTHVVTGSIPFYEIEVEGGEDGSTLCGLAVTDENGPFEHRERYVNTLAGERVFHVETDERQRVYVRFGQEGVVGTQPADGVTITVTAYYSVGDAELRVGGPMVFEQVAGVADAAIEMQLDAILVPGQNPPSMKLLRELAKYPAVYNHNAVFLGEFDFLVRRNFPTLKFLSVWNESAEESVRGMSLDNINTLFVACLSKDGGEPVLTQAAGEHVAPQVITTLSGTQQAIKAKILAADDSYRVRFYTPVRSKIAMSVDATISSSYVESEVREQIRQALLSAFGEESEQSRRGQNSPLYQQVYQLLRESVPALAVGRADLRLTIDDPAEDAGRPELWRYVAEDSLAVRVILSNVTTPYWGAGF